MKDLFGKSTRSIKDYIPNMGKALVNVTRDEVIDKVGKDVINRIVASILCGDNVRSLTEGLTRRRITLSNASMLYAYTHAMSNIENFAKHPELIVRDEFKRSKLSNEDKIYLNWMLGLSKKGIQNILRDSDDNLEEYLTTLNRELVYAADTARKELGDISAIIRSNAGETQYSLENLLHVMMAIGAQTLTIRGSEKSVYGKLFERLVLGSLLTLFDFKYINKDDASRSDMVFWLSERGDKREADATVLVKAGMGARFDMGFIGKGNPEISLDKVSRFEKELERGEKNHYMSTIILVDTIGAKSGIQRLAKDIDGEIVQMSMSYWVKQVASIFYERLNLESPILHLDDEASLEYIRDKMNLIDVHGFVTGDDWGQDEEE